MMKQFVITLVAAVAAGGFSAGANQPRKCADRSADRNDRRDGR